VNGEAGTTAGLSRFSLSFSPTQPRHAWGFFFARQSRDVGIHSSAEIQVRLYPNSQRHLRAVAILVEARRRRPMRAYLTAAGMALGLVGVWAALVPFVA
jgi:hypothetical protein